MREHFRRFVCWLLGHHPVGPPFYSPMCARCGLILHDNCTAWGDDPDYDKFVAKKEQNAT